MFNKKAIREPLFHISKRAPLPFWHVWGIRAVAIVSAFVVSIIMSRIFLGIGISEFFSSMFKGSFGSEKLVWIMLKSVAMLLCVSVALAPAFKMKFWNIGADGQVLMGCTAAYVCKRFLAGSMPSSMLVLVCLGAAIVAGAVWAVIPAIFKARWNTNETLFTLMMNYIATQIVLHLKDLWANGQALPEIKAGNLEQIYYYLSTVLIVVFITAFMFVYLKYSKHGYEIAVVGESKNTAKYIGININKTVIRTLILSGAICGITGFLLICGQKINIGLNDDIVGGIGFTAIIVAWLAKFNPGYMVLTSFFVVFLENGAGNLYSENNAYGKIIVGIVFFMVIGCEFFITYQLKRNGKKHNGELFSDNTKHNENKETDK